MKVGEQADSMKCYSYLRNVQENFSDWKTPYERRFGMPFTGPIIRLVQWSNVTLFSAKDESRLHQFGSSYQENFSVMHL